MKLVALRHISNQMLAAFALVPLVLVPLVLVSLVLVSLVLVSLVLVSLVLATGCRYSPDQPAKPLAAPTAPTAPPAAAPVVFVGSAACAGCHPAEYKTQSHSRHAQTLYPMSRKLLGSLAPPTGTIPGTEHVIQRVEDRYLIASAARPDMAVPLDFAFGSGKTGMTYVVVPDDTRLIELRSSYFPHQKQWYATPGQEHLAAEYMGAPFPQQLARECFLCHAVTLADNAVAPQRQFFGVGCEDCHGPGSAHIASIRAGHRGESPMERLASRSATRLNALCGKCHGTEQEAHDQPLDTVRLQAVGLMRSRCFKQSRDTLSCITCHDPHTDVSTNTRSYETLCLQCHSASKSAKRPLPLRTATIRSCPVNPHNGCIGCHMPKRQAIAGATAPTLMADHLIRVFAKSR